eukprot:Skav217739  [mRNA]  locus=scaffold2847:64696:67839:+ [translate_table: standard]
MPQLRFGAPISVTLLLITWVLLLTMGGGLGPVKRFPTAALQQRYEKLGHITRQELGVAEPSAFTDATAVMLTTLPLFFLPGKEDGAILQWNKTLGLCYRPCWLRHEDRNVDGHGEVDDGGG